MSMQIKPGVWQQRTIKLTMTQELTQAIALLQYNVQELTSFLETKAVENPLIELTMPYVKALKKKEQPLTGVKKQDVNWIEHMPDEKRTVSDFMSSQFQLASFTAMQRRIFDELIHHIDENGYMNVDADQTASRLGASKRDVTVMIRRIQQAEPAGIGAKDLQECLLLQVERRLDVPYIAEQLLRDHFDAFAQKQWKPIAKKLNIEMKAIQEAADFIRTLNPKPGAAFAHEPSSYVRPDLSVQVTEKGLEVTALQTNLPKVKFQTAYAAQLRAYADKDVKQFVKEHEKDYHWLIKSLEQRGQTIYRVGVAIAKKQRRFFENGPSALQPLTLKEIADELSVHESTVSRTVRGKYMQTPFGLYEMKAFFLSGTAASSHGESASSHQVKLLIQSHIEQEDKRKPLSDQAICELLLKEKMPVSRRTVAKYREQLNIPSSSKRKRYE